MLKARIITALLLVPVLISAIIFLPTHILAYLFAAFILLAGWEWSALSGFTSTVSRLAYLILLSLLMFNTFEWIERLNVLNSLLYAVLIYWLLVFLWLSVASSKQLLANAVNVYFRGAIGLMLLLPTWLSLLALHARPEFGPQLLLSFFILIWVADSGAYFSGKFRGSRKLAPTISPGKTLEGVYGALFITPIAAVPLAFFLGYESVQIVVFSVIALFCTVFSIVGDLFESVSKRAAGVKDSGQLFPGHGGVMDRIDSLTAAAPLFLLALSWFQGLL